MPTPTEPTATRPSELDAPHRRAHSAGMVVPFDSLAASEAMESAGMEPRQARAVAAQLLAVTSAGQAVTRPELEAALATFKTELLHRIAETERGLVERMARVELGLVDRIAGSECRQTALLWRLFGGTVAALGLAVAAIKYLP